MADPSTIVVFVHGWSVTDTDTYGSLPHRLRAEAGSHGLSIKTEEIHLGKYISFHDEVRVTDIARAFESAVRKQLGGAIKKGRRFVCITHSTGGPVIRDWWHRYYRAQSGKGLCPLSHLVMLAPANYGSALAQLGKGRISRLRYWVGGREPGQGVLDWLELGSAQAWDLNLDWIRSDGTDVGVRGVFPFVLTGQSIDRAFYDNLNSYTGESGSDGVVRVAAANLNGRYIRLEQATPEKDGEPKRGFRAPGLKVAEFAQAPESALRIVAGKSHSGKTMGIMRSVHKTARDKKSAETVSAILSCIAVGSKAEYNTLSKSFATETSAVQEQERLERETKLLKDRYFIHDRGSQVIFRVRDDRGYAVPDFDLILTAGADGNPNHLPSGFFRDRQRNRRNPEIITYFFNYDVMKGSAAVTNKDGKEIRKQLPGAEMLGMVIKPRPRKGFVHYLPCEIRASAELLDKALMPNGTTLIDIRLRRVVHDNVFATEALKESGSTSFKNDKPSGQPVS
jgi:hypothetical protein